MLFEIYDCLKFSILYCTLLPGEKLNLVILPSKSYKELRWLSEKKKVPHPFFKPQNSWFPSFR